MNRSADSPEDDDIAGRSRDQVAMERHRQYLAGLARVGAWRRKEDKRDAE